MSALLRLACTLTPLCVASGCDANCPLSTERVGSVCRPRRGAASAEDAGAADGEGSTQSAVVTRGAGAQSQAGAGGAGGMAGSARASAGMHAAVGGEHSAGARATADAGARPDAGEPPDEGGAPSTAHSAGAGAACSPSAEVCDGADNDCDGRSDEMVQRRCWADQDEDGFAASAASVTETCDQCGDHSTETEPTSAANTDCDDADKTRSPGATDICGDNVDNNCDGTPDNEATNACGGPCLMQLPGKPGDPCTNGLKGACARKGTFACTPEHGLACNAEAVTGTQEVCGDQSDNDCDGTVDNGCVKNSCGGWTKLARPAGSACSVGDGACRSAGQYECVGLDETACAARPKPDNGCGGCSLLLHKPGQSCSAECGGTGQWMCRGADDVVCSAVAKPRNVCGGCTTLAIPVGTPCSGDCNATGSYQCMGLDATVCKLPVTRNSCGGCTPIPEREARGKSCSAGNLTCEVFGEYVCNLDNESTRCNAVALTPTNRCGGCVPIEGVEPTTPCIGPNGENGAWVCQTDHTTFCSY